MDIAEVVRRLGGDPTNLQRRDPQDRYYIDDDECLYFLDQAGSAVSIVEANGMEATRPEILRPLSDGARVHGAYWNVNLNNHFSYVVDGRLITALEYAGPIGPYGTDPHALDTDLPDLIAIITAENNGPWMAAMLAAVETRTAVSLDDNWPLREHPSIAAPILPTIRCNQLDQTQSRRHLFHRPHRPGRPVNSPRPTTQA